MQIPRVLREQVKAYAREGFHVIDVQPRAGAHFMVRFAEIDGQYLISKNAACPRAVKNNVAAYRRQLKPRQENRHADGTDRT